jgi:hypothetical protein
MSNPDWYPIKLADRIAWHANYSFTAQAVGTNYGLSAADQADIARDAANVPLVVAFKEAAQGFAQAVTEWAELVLNGPAGGPFPPAPTAPVAPTFDPASKPAIRPRTRRSAGIVKADSDYSRSVGERFGIIAPEAGPRADPSIRRAEPSTGSSRVALRLKKGGYALIAVDMRRSGGAWEQIGVSQTATFVDATPPLVAGQPEQREYRVQGMLANARTGRLSATVSAVTVP